MAVVIGADFQMFVLWKEARDPFNPSHFTRGKGCSSHVTAVGAPKGGETPQWWAFRVLFPWKMKYGFVYCILFYFYFFATKQKSFRSELFWSIFFPFWLRLKAAAAQQKDTLSIPKPVLGDCLQKFCMKHTFFKKNRGGQKSVYGNRNLNAWSSSPATKNCCEKKRQMVCDNLLCYLTRLVCDYFFIYSI